MKKNENNYKNIQRDYQDSTNQRFRTILDFLNNVSNPEEIGDVLNGSENISDLAKLSKSLIAHRNKLEGFTDIKQLTEVSGVDDRVMSTIRSAFERPSFPFDEDKLQHVMWVHGSSLHVEDPEAFGRITKYKNGTRITGSDVDISESFVHIAIPTPTFSSGTRFSIGSIMALWRTSWTTYSTGPFVNVLHAEFWDGNQLLAVNPPFEISWLSNGYLITKFIFSSNRKINFGIGASFKQIIEIGQSSALGWADYASVGAEFVTRKNSTFLPTALNQSD